MEIAYLCAARVSDVLKMNWNQILEKGIFIQQGKTGVKQIKSGQIAYVMPLKYVVNGERKALLSGLCMASVILIKDLTRRGERRERLRG